MPAMRLGTCQVCGEDVWWGSLTVKGWTDKVRISEDGTRIIRELRHNRCHPWVAFWRWLTRSAPGNPSSQEDS